MALAFVIVACIFFLFAGFSVLHQPFAGYANIGWLGLFFWAASTILGKL